MQKNSGHWLFQKICYIFHEVAQLHICDVLTSLMLIITNLLVIVTVKIGRTFSKVISKSVVASLLT